VHELQRAAVGQDPAGAQRVGRLGGLAVVELRDRCRVPNERAVAHYRCRAGELLGRLGEAGEPRPDRRDDAAGRGVQHIGGAIEAGLAQRARELAQEERVPTGQRMAAAAEGRQGLGDGGAHELRRRVVAERRGAQQCRRAAFGQHLGDRGATRLSERPRRHNKQDRHLAQAVAEIGQEPQRRRVGPVRVVDQQRQRPAAGEVGREAEETVQDGERSLRSERQMGGLR
jgi:hypothetical protein